MSFRTVLASTALLAVPIAPLPAHAEEERWAQTPETVPPRLVEVGTWQFAATKRGPDGKPECFESWTFNGDGTGEIVSGEQRVVTRWEYKPFEDMGHFVFIDNLSSTGSPDCMGRTIDSSRYPRKSAGFQLIFMEQGQRAMVCDGGQVINEADGSRSFLLGAEDCWGTIEAISGR
jgi:hypothetical protein